MFYEVRYGLVLRDPKKSFADFCKSAMNSIVTGSKASREPIPFVGQDVILDLAHAEGYAHGDQKAINSKIYFDYVGSFLFSHIFS